VIPGIAQGIPGTWADLWRYLNPTRQTPERCPWSEANPPPGFSYQSFMERKPDKKTITAMQRGVGAMKEELPDVRINYANLRFLEAVAVDDHRLDVLVMGEFAGRIQLVELWALFLMDIATRKIVWVQLHPRYVDETGETVGIRARDVQHAFAHMFATYGLPLHYRCQILCENAAAVITQSCEEIFKRATDGRVWVRRSGTFDSKMWLAGFSESGGNPQGKAVIESFFGRRFDKAFGRVKGQIGARYQLKPGQLERALQQANRVIKKLGNVATMEEMETLVINFHDIARVRPAILATLHHIETDPKHNLQGFEHVIEWRLSEVDQWRAPSDPALMLMMQTHGAAYVSQFLDLPGISRPRMETVAERAARMCNPADFARPSPEAICEMWMDEAPGVYSGGDVLALNMGKRGGGVHEFYGSRHHLIPGQKVVARLDLDYPQAGCWLYHEDGRFLGRMDYRDRTDYGDEEGLKKQLAVQAKAEASILKGVRRVGESREVLMEQLRDQTERLDTLRTVAARVDSVLEPTKGNREFIEALAGEAEAELPERRESTSFNDFYLDLHQHD
jgi:hypothetical protein